MIETQKRIATCLKERKARGFPFYYHVFIAKLSKKRAQLIPRRIAIGQSRYPWSSISGHFATIAVAKNGTFGFVVCSDGDNYFKKEGRIRATAKLTAAIDQNLPSWGPTNFYEHSLYKFKENKLREFVGEALAKFLEDGIKRRSEQIRPSNKKSKRGNR